MTDDNFKLTRRKALAGLTTIGIAGVGAGMGTSALFSDEEEFENNSIEAGELDLFVDYATSVTQDGVDTGSTTNDGTIQGGVSGKYQISDVKPGDSGSLVFCPKIVDNPGWLFVGSADGVTDFENGQTEPEQEVDDSGGDPGKGNGELSENIQVTVSYCEYGGSGDRTNPDNFDTIREFNNPADYTLADLFKELESGFLLDGTPNTSGTQEYPSSPNNSTQNGPCLCVEWEVPLEVGNEIQTDSVEFDITFAARQSRNNPDPENPFATTTVHPGEDLAAAVSNANSGDTISVFGGSFGDGTGDYDGALSVDKSLTLARASAEQPVVKDTSGDNIETVSISASNVVFDGFEVTGTQTPEQNAGIRVEAPSDSAIGNIQVCNSVVRDIVAQARATGIGIDADQGPIPDPGADGTVNNIEVYNCRIESISNTSPLNPSPYGDSRAKGVAMNGRIFDPTVRHVTIQNVGDSNNTTFGRGITISEDPGPNPPVGATNLEVVFSHISGMAGNFQKNNKDYGAAAMFIGEYPDFGDHVVENNNLENLVENFPNGTPPQPTNDVLNAPNNWWGASDGPSGPGGSGSGVAVTENVDFDPYRSSALTDVGSTV
jgi:predicted ribosomally synthesized peptide with SipW-like signal peptide